MLKRLLSGLQRSKATARDGAEGDWPPRFAAIHSALERGELAQAAAGLDALPAAAFSLAAPHSLAGRLHLAKGERAAAAERFETALALDAQDLSALCGLARLHWEAGEAAAAAELYQCAARLAPALPGLQMNLALALERCARWDAALGHAELARSDRANLAGALQLLGRLHERAGSWQAAGELYREACAAFPADALLWAGQGRTARAQADYALAEQAFARADALAPDAGFALDIGLAQFHRHDYPAACASFERCLAARSDWPEAAFSLANAQLARGDLARGWAGYAARFRVPGRAWPEVAVAPWTGERLDGETLLVDAEQGYGDCFLAARFLRRAAARGGRLVLRVRRPALRLLAASGLTDAVVAADDAVAADRHCYLFDLPGILGIDSVDALAANAYLRAPEAARDEWKHRLAGAEFKIGLVWSGLASAPQNRYRMFDPQQLLAQLARLPGIRIFGLQLAGEGIAPCPQGVEDLSAALDDFGETAGILANLDLLISADTATAHLAGGMGVPVWVPLALGADWRWRIGNKENPWYESARLFRQTQPMRWDEVFAAIAAELMRSLADRKRPC